MQLTPGDKLILYTDGIEIPFEDATRRATGEPAGHIAAVAGMASLPVEDIISRLSEWIDRRQGSLQPTDDITVLAVEVSPQR